MFRNINTCSYNDTYKYTLSTTVIKAFHLLEFIANNQPVQPSYIVKALGFSRANVHRMLSTLIQVGYVEKQEKGYGLTFKLFKLGSSVPLSCNLRDISKPVMTELMKIAGENIYLNVLVDDLVIAIDEVKSSHYLTVNPDATYTYPVHTCASGKILLSGLCPEQLESFTETLSLTERTESTITEKNQLLEEVETVRKNGYALEIKEWSEDLSAVAAAIFDYRQKIVAAISISGPSIRLTNEQLNNLKTPLMIAASQISERLGKGLSIK